MTRLPVWRTAVDVWRLLLGRPGTLFRLGFPALMVLVAGQALATALSAGPMIQVVETLERAMATLPGGAPSDEVEARALALAVHQPMLAALAGQLLGLLVLAAALVMALVAWCRFVVLGELREGRWLVFRFGEHEIETVAAIVILGIGAFAITVAALVASILAVAAFDLAGQAVMAVLFTGLILALCRFAMVLPQAAVGGGLDPRAAWRRTRGQTWRLFAIHGLAGLPVFLLGIVVQLLLLLALVFGAGIEDVALWPERALVWLGSPWGLALAAVGGVAVLGLHALLAALVAVTLGVCHARLVDPG